jgi:hypothetical protein
MTSITNIDAQGCRNLLDSDDRDHARTIPAAGFDRGHEPGESVLASRTPPSTSHGSSTTFQAIERYFDTVDCRPYPVLAYLYRDRVPVPSDFEPLVLDALLALTLPILAHCSTVSNQEAEKLGSIYTKSAWQGLCQNYQTMEFDITFFQVSCLLSQSDFAGTCFLSDKPYCKLTHSSRQNVQSSNAGRTSYEGCRAQWMVQS